MRILVSNDDGVSAPGIQVLAKALSDIADVYVMAPDRNRSGASNSLTLTNPLRVRKLDNGYHSIEGTPTDCVHLALTGFFDFDFDMVVSGINDGANLGDDVLYSGTIAAAMEGRNLGFPAIAVSLAGRPVEHYETAATIVTRLARKLKSDPLRSQTILNINVPNVPLDGIRGIEVTRLGTRHAAEATIKTRDPRGRAIYWIGSPGEQADAGPGTDFHAISQQNVSITPLHLDMTHYKIFEQVSCWTKDAGLIQ
ncbi:MAG: 5'/3'-nucleotidase SurE [Gammaproteobacteria bacterium]|nr:5'/3'-nucleotidase SurE [Gammaproteobacteria bacterium]MCH9717611.1 5'/3'-nucleotidase SurE [Gammaproteobacteria bacterium]MCH9762632.1 5'/3'-nucleotidase SurE [Gammaproteobacteria bacterium]